MKVSWYFRKLRNQLDWLFKGTHPLTTLTTTFLLFKVTKEVKAELANLLI